MWMIPTNPEIDLDPQVNYYNRNNRSDPRMFAKVFKCAPLALTVARILP